MYIVDIYNMYIVFGIQCTLYIVHIRVNYNLVHTLCNIIYTSMNSIH